MWQEHRGAYLPGSRILLLLPPRRVPPKFLRFSGVPLSPDMYNGEGQLTHNLGGFQGLKAYKSALRPSYYFYLFQSHRNLSVVLLAAPRSKKQLPVEVTSKNATQQAGELSTNRYDLAYPGRSSQWLKTVQLRMG